MALSRLFMIVGALLAGLAVAGGAFASHALKAQLSEKALGIFETGVRYQMYHALALLFVGLLLRQSEIASWPLLVSGYAFCLGIILFSGSLYALSLSDVRALGAITPLGGVAFLVGWGCIVAAVALGR